MNAHYPIKTIAVSWSQLSSLLFVLACQLFIGSAQAADNPPPAEAAAEPVIESAESISRQQISDLISTLENDAARQEFISNLETLVSSTEQEQDFSFSFTDIFKLDETSSEVVDNYLELINSMGISDTTVGKAVVLGITTVLILILIYANNRLSKFMRKKLDRHRSRFGFSDDRFRLLLKGQKAAGIAVGVLLLVYASAYVSGNSEVLLGPNSLGITAMSYLVATLLIVFFVVAAWEIVNAIMEYGIHENSSLDTTRMKTLFPVVRNLAFIVILTLTGLVILSELGIDIVPLLAGAGVLGIAIGFGAQTMVKDFLNGFIIILEDLVQVGDVINVGDRIGKVEQITLRKIQLRNLDGTVHTVPHSEIAVVDNLTKEFSYYLMKVGISYQEDTDEVIKCLEKVDEEIRESDEFSDRILAPLEVLGVDEFADSAVVIKVRTKTKAHDKWRVGREFNRRIKKAFDEQGIEIPFPHRTIYFGDGPFKLATEDSDSLSTANEETT